MRRKHWAAAMLLATAAAVMTMVLSAGRVEEAEQARVARVERGDVEVVSALRGVLGYGGLFTVYAQTPGRVEEVYAVQGQRVTQGQALMRMDAKSAEQAASAWAAQGSPEAVAQDVRQLLVKKAFSTTYGARNLRRTIQKELEDPISEAIIDSFEKPISAIDLTVENEEVKLNIQ